MASMSRAILLALLPGAWLSVDALGVPASRETLATDLSPLSEWKYYPPGAKVGIVTGGTPDLYENFNYGAKDASIMLKYAKIHGYAMYVDKNMGRLSDRRKGWNKVVVMHKLLREVNTLVWMDADMIVKQLDTPMEELMDKAQCDGARQPQWNTFLPRRANNQTFLWLNADVSPHRHLVNANTAMVVMKRTADAFRFLEEVWEVGKEPDHYKHHSDPLSTFHKDPKSSEYGWPFEQGAFWDVMAKNPEVYMKGACIAPSTHFHSVRVYMYKDGVFAKHMGGVPNQFRRDEAQLMLDKAGVRPEIH